MKLLSRYGILLVAIATLPLQAAQAQSANETRREQVAANFREADADGDGALTRDEFTQLIDLNAQQDIGRARLIVRFDRYDLAFGRADANSDGGVTAEELLTFSAQNR